MNRITIYSADERGNKRNCLYPNRHVVETAEQLKEAVSHDNVVARYKGDYRSNRNFETADCMAFDCDNDHSDLPAEWKTPMDVSKAFPGVSFYAVYSRNHNRWKKGKSPRPRFHIYFPIEEIRDVESYSAFKESVTEYFPYFDTNAKDAARFFFGIKDPVVEFYGGDA